MTYSLTIEDGVEYAEKISRILDYSLLFLVSALPNTPPWLDRAVHIIHHSRDMIELATCAKEMLSKSDPEASNLCGRKLILFSAIITPFAIAHAWARFPLLGWEAEVEKAGRWTMAFGHGILAFEERGIKRIDMAGEALFFTMEAAFLDSFPPSLQWVVGAGSGLWQCYRIPHQHKEN